MTVYNFIQIRELTEVHDLAKIKQLTCRDLPREADIIKLLEKLEEDKLLNEKLWVIMVVFTGRRFRDFERLSWKNVSVSGGIVACMLPKDKMHTSKIITFSFKLSSWNLDYDIKKEIALIKHLSARSEGKVILGESKTIVSNKKQKIQRRSSSFTLHSLRNRHALKLLISGNSVETVLDIIGWDSIESLQRYVIITPEQIAKFSTYDACYKFILNDRNLG